MLIKSIANPPSEWKADLLVLILDKNEQFFELEDEKLKAQAEALKAQYDEGKRSGPYLFFEPSRSEDIGAILACYTGDYKGFSAAEVVKICVAEAVKYASKTNRYSVLFALNSPVGLQYVGKAAEAVGMAMWSFDRYKKEKKDLSEQMVISFAVSEEKPAEAALNEGLVLANCVNMARNICCEPGDIINPQTLCAMGKELAEEFGYDFVEYDEPRLKEEGFNGHLKVGSGSQYPPCMFAITYNPAPEKDQESSEPVPHFVMVGKGLTFDSGGISIKPAAKMHEMKGDMAGAAAVLATMRALGTLRPNIKVTAIVCSAENMPDAKAQRPGDIIVYKNGKSVHVENTDAEGRLVLADGLILAGELGATHVIDICTLTGACVRALGESFTGIMGSNRSLVNAITFAGGVQGESYWKLPLPLEYKDMLKTPFADLSNVGGPTAGAITAGLFLKEFVPENVSWAHLDIAGPAWRSKEWKYYPAGPTGVGVRTLTELAWHWNEYFKK
ncbi:MAG: leucyl aminopeptidase family protein [Candidatus Bruticola sp.]